MQEDACIYDVSRDIFECEYGNEHEFARLTNKRDGVLLRVYVSKRHTIRKNVDFVWLQKHRKRFLEPEYADFAIVARRATSAEQEWLENFQHPRYGSQDPRHGQTTAGPSLIARKMSHRKPILLHSSGLIGQPLNSGVSIIRVIHISALKRGRDGG